MSNINDISRDNSGGFDEPPAEIQNFDRSEIDLRGLSLNDEDVDAMIRVKIALDACPMSTESTSDTDDRDHFRKNFRKYCRSVTYQKILKSVNEYLHLHCKHSYVVDSIDIDPDRSETIRYCEKCYLSG